MTVKKKKKVKEAKKVVKKLQKAKTKVVVQKAYFDALCKTGQSSAETDFIDSFNEFAVDVNKNALDHGFWEGEQNHAEKLMLMVSELSEALEAIRSNDSNEGGPWDEKIPEFKNLEIELADCVIRIMDYCTYNKLRLPEAIAMKHRYNKTRPYKHNKKF